jgi:HTH-type transcriptional regulator/antitoxin HigA
MPETAFQPNWVSPPGETIADVLRERKLTVGEFSQRIGQTQEQTAELLLGHSKITLGLARRLSDVLGGSVEFWMARDFRYHQQIAKPGLIDNAWLRELPLADMVRLGWIREAPEPSQQLADCLTFFGVPNIAAWHRAFGKLEQKFAFRTSPSFESRPAAVAAWLRQGELEAEKIDCAPWNAQHFQAALSEIRGLTREKDPEVFLPELQRICAQAGVAVVIVRAPAGCHASGATRFVTPQKAMLLLSFRFLSDDQFWFSFFHEAGHVLLHGKQEVFIEGIETPNASPEQEANEFAASTLVPPQYESELMRVRSNKYDLVRFARRIGVSPGIVVGQLQHYGKIKHNHFNGLKRRYTWK